jgi:hypothetical protein
MDCLHGGFICHCLPFVMGVTVIARYITPAISKQMGNNGLEFGDLKSGTNVRHKPAASVFCYRFDSVTRHLKHGFDALLPRSKALAVDQQDCSNSLKR